MPNSGVSTEDTSPSDEDKETSPQEPSAGSMDLGETSENGQTCGSSHQWEQNATETMSNPFTKRNQPMPLKNCLPQRAALLKSMLNFLKKAIQDAAFTEVIRHVMEGSLPASLKHIISNAEYYGPSLFLLATDVVTVYVFQEPSHLSCLQDNGLTFVVLHALLVKDVSINLIFKFIYTVESLYMRIIFMWFENFRSFELKATLSPITLTSHCNLTCACAVIR